jgi:serine/threonine protein kinase
MIFFQPCVMCDTTLDFSPPTPDKLSSLLSGYAVESLLSTGINGTIYLAHQVSLDRKIAIKVLPAKDAALAVAFESEAKIMARFNDPNLVKVFDFGIVNDILYIIMEYISGQSLCEKTLGHHLDQMESARIMVDVCRGLHHAHQTGIVHQALQPKNILITQKTHPKIVGFGLSKLFVDRAEQLTNPYSAPEVYQTSGKVDHRADIYSAGLILYNLVVGCLPNEPYSPPSSIRNSCIDLDAIIFKSIHPDPKRRYASAKEMAIDLEKMIAELSTSTSTERIKTLVTSVPAQAKPLAKSLPTLASSSSKSAVTASFIIVAVLLGIIITVANINSQPPSNKKTTTKDYASAIAEEPRAIPYNPKPRLDRQQQPRKPSVKITPLPPSKPAPPNKPVNVRPQNVKPPVVPSPQIVAKTSKPPEFDREKWLLETRYFIHKKGASTLADYDKAILKNINRFERTVKRSIRKMDRDMRKPAEVATEKTFQLLRNLKHLPNERPDEIPDLVHEMYGEALDGQSKINANFLDDFQNLRMIYTQTLNKKISILRSEGNEEHADILADEMKASQQNIEGFIMILREHETKP